MSDLMENANERAEGIGAPAGALEKTVEFDIDKVEDTATQVSDTPSKHDPEALNAHVEAGHDLIPIAGKAPLAKGWPSMPALSLDKAKARMAAGRNVGVRLRDTDLVIDVDPRHFDEDDDPLARLAIDFGLADAPFVMTGGGGRHLYFTKPAEIEIAGKLAGYGGIEFKSKGGQVVAAGSIHPDTGCPYRLDDDALAMSLSEAPEATTALLDAIGKHSVEASADAGAVDEERLAEWLGHIDVTEYKDQKKWQDMMMACHFATNGAGVNEFIAWSTSDPDYAEHDDIIRRRWNSLDVKPNSITARTLIAALPKEMRREATELLYRVSAEDDFPVYDEGGGEESDNVWNGWVFVAEAKGRRPRVLLAYDGERIAAVDTSPKFDEEPLRVGLDMLSLEGDVFFPLGGHERYVPKKERMADVRATRFISRFHDAVRDANPDWTTEADRHALNIFMARVLFCLFSDDVGIFEKDTFETAVRQSNVDGADLAAFLDGAFQHMDTPPERRSSETRPWSKLKYVNGSLFEEDVPMPALDGRCRKLLLDCAGLNWKLINPDIFGSMLQAVVDVDKRGELGMHYTSPANIMKVLEPILLDPLQAELERAGANKARLRDFLERLGRIRVFDPACGSGNFLILAYKELRALETQALRRLATPRLSGIALEQFFGVEIDDFACQAARLGLWIAKYQCDQQLELDLGQRTDFLPLQKAGVIVTGNAAEIDWQEVCPPVTGAETVVVGNPQFRGSSYWSPEQKADMARVFKGRVKNWGNLDYVTLWFAKARDYSLATGAPFAFVATNSIVQGVQVPELWPHLLENLAIRFAHRSFTGTSPD